MIVSGENTTNLAEAPCVHLSPLQGQPDPEFYIYCSLAFKLDYKYIYS